MGPMTLGWLGCVVRPWFFYQMATPVLGPKWDPPPLKWEPPDHAWPDECFRHDDLWLSATLAQRGVRRASHNLGLPAFVEDLQASQAPGKALFYENRWNLHVCNRALLARFPGLWEPRARVVAFAPAASGEGLLGQFSGQLIGGFVL